MPHMHMPHAPEGKVWQWIAGCAISFALGGGASTLMSSQQIRAISSEIRDHQERGHAVVETRVDRNQADIDELETLLREAVAEMRRFHSQE